MAKSFFMIGQAAGFDMSSQEGMNAFMLEYNERLLAGQSFPEYNPDSKITRMISGVRNKLFYDN